MIFPCTLTAHNVIHKARDLWCEVGVTINLHAFANHEPSSTHMIELCASGESVLLDGFLLTCVGLSTGVNC